MISIIFVLHLTIFSSQKTSFAFRMHLGELENEDRSPLSKQMHKHVRRKMIIRNTHACKTNDNKKYSHMYAPTLKWLLFVWEFSGNFFCIICLLREMLSVAFWKPRGTHVVTLWHLGWVKMQKVASLILLKWRKELLSELKNKKMVAQMGHHGVKSFCPSLKV